MLFSLHYSRHLRAATLGMVRSASRHLPEVVRPRGGKGRRDVSERCGEVCERISAAVYGCLTSEPVRQRGGDAQAATDHAIAEPGLSQGEDLVSAHLGPGTSDPRPESLGPSQAGGDPFTDQVPFELREHGEHPEHRPAGGGGRVDRLIQHHEVDAECFELPAEGDQVLERTCQAIELRADDHADRAPTDGLQERVKIRPALLGAADAMIHVLADLPPSRPAVRPELLDLRGRILVEGGDASVDGGRHERRPDDRSAPGAGGRQRTLSPFCLRLVCDLVCGRGRPHTGEPSKLRGTTTRVVRLAGVEPATLGLEARYSACGLLPTMLPMRRYNGTSLGITRLGWTATNC